MNRLLLFLIPGTAFAGSFPTNDFIEDSVPTIWATSAIINRGPVDATVPDGAVATFGSASDAIGAADAAATNRLSVVSLGDGGTATLEFSTPFADGAGDDFAVFENGFSSFGGFFLELAHVEVSSDGVNFVRFPSVSETSTDTQIGGFGTLDATNLHNLAGKHETGKGTAFDLSELSGTSPHLDINRITHVRIIDVVGSIDPTYGTTDSLGKYINDPYKTNFTSGGFDLDAVGAIYPALGTTPESWTAENFPEGGEDGDEDDPDGDRIANLLEYALDGNPNDFSSNPLTLTPGTNSATLVWQRAVGHSGVILQLEGSNNLSDWTVLCEAVGEGATTSSISGVVVSESNDGATVTTTLDSSYQFFRLKALRP